MVRGSLRMLRECSIPGMPLKSFPIQLANISPCGSSCIPAGSSKATDFSAMKELLRKSTEKTLDRRHFRWYTIRAKQRRLTTRLTFSESEKVRYRSFGAKLRFFGCGCCRHPHFCRVMEVLYHRQIRSSAQRRNSGRGNSPDWRGRRNARNRFFRGSVENG